MSSEELSVNRALVVETTIASEDHTTPEIHDSLADVVVPEWLRYWRRHHSPRGHAESSTWGFVVFRTSLYADEQRWQKFKTEMIRVVNLSFARERETEQGRTQQEDSSPSHLPDDYDTAVSHFELRWIEDSTLADATANTLRTRYNIDLKPSLSPGLANTVFLVATPAVTHSVLSVCDDDDDNNKRPNIKSKFWRRNAPYFITVDADYNDNLDAQFNEEYDSFMRVKPSFKAAAESVASELWVAVNCDARPLWQRTLAVRAAEEIEEEVPKAVNEVAFLEDVWWSAGPTPASLRRRRPWLYAGQPEIEDED